MTLHVKNARLLIEGALIRGDLLAENGIITALGAVEPSADAVTVDAEGAILAAGFIDLHTHGAVGIDVNAADSDGFLKISKFFAAHGVTGWLGSVLTDTEEATLRAIDAAKTAMRDEDATLLGIHLEGPFLSEQYAGAMPKHLLQTGNADLVRRYLSFGEGAVRTMTVSPEVEGVAEMIGAVGDDLVICLGHSAATYDEAMASIDAGAACITHTFNAMRLFHQHEPAIMGAALMSDVYCEAICDGLHLHPATVKLLIGLKGFDRVIPVTDSIMAAGLPDGDYRLGVNEITVKDGDAMLKDKPVRAGSTLTMDRALKNMLKFTGEPIEKLLPMFSENPARLLGLSDRIGRIAVGCEASFNLLDDDGTLKQTYIRAKRA